MDILPIYEGLDGGGGGRGIWLFYWLQIFGTKLCWLDYYVVKVYCLQILRLKCYWWPTVGSNVFDNWFWGYSIETLIYAQVLFKIGCASGPCNPNGDGSNEVLPGDFGNRGGRGFISGKQGTKNEGEKGTKTILGNRVRKRFISGEHGKQVAPCEGLYINISRLYLKRETNLSLANLP